MLKIETAGCFETSVHLSQTTLCHNAVDGDVILNFVPDPVMRVATAVKCYRRLL
jgi:hypothetical protein